MVVTKGVPQHVRVHPGQSHASGLGQAVQPAGGGMPVHACTSDRAQDRAALTARDRPVDGPADRWWYRRQHERAVLAGDLQHPVAVLLGQVGDVGGAGFEDPQPEEAEHGHQREVVDVARLPSGREHRLELQMGRPRVGESAGTVGRRTCSAGEWSRTPSMTQVAYKPATTESRLTVDGLTVSDLLHPPQIQLQLRSGGREWDLVMAPAPGQVGTQIRDRAGSGCVV
jgi:hypothetical protein